MKETQVTHMFNQTEEFLSERMIKLKDFADKRVAEPGSITDENIKSVMMDLKAILCYLVILVVYTLGCRPNEACLIVTYYKERDDKYHWRNQVSKNPRSFIFGKGTDKSPYGIHIP